MPKDKHMPPLPKKKLAVFHHPMGLELYDGLAMDLHAMTYAEAVQAAERERVRAAIEEFPHWLGPQAKKELLEALYGPN